MTGEIINAVRCSLDSRIKRVLLLRDEVLSADFNLEGTKIVSAGMDHRFLEIPVNVFSSSIGFHVNVSHLRLVFSLKIWQFDSEALEEAVKLSYTHDTLKTKTVFPTGDFYFLGHFRHFKSFLRALSLP